MENNWEDYKKHYLEIMDYIREFKKRHGWWDGKNATIDDLALRLARQRAGIKEDTAYGQ